MFIVRDSLVLDSKLYVQFRIIFSLLCTIIVYKFEVDLHSVQQEKRSMKPTNMRKFSIADKISPETLICVRFFKEEEECAI